MYSRAPELHDRRNFERIGANGSAANERASSGDYRNGPGRRHLWRNISARVVPAVWPHGSRRKPGRGRGSFFLSSSIGDLLEDKEEPNRTRSIAALGLAAAIVVYFLIMRFKESAGG
jgi:hypothetical protein